MKMITLALAAVSMLAMPALAKGGNMKNHHCMKDGSEMAGMTRKQCKKGGGKWEKMKKAPAADAAPAAAPADAAPAK